MANTPGSAAVALDALSAQLMSDFSQAELVEAGEFTLAMILERTKTGIDADGQPFAAYAPAYAKERTRVKLGTQPDLARTGHMLGGLGITGTARNEVTLGFLSAREEQKATWHNAGTVHVPQREFLAVKQQKELDAIADVVTEGIVERIERGGQ